jgi:hypothetical protein
MTGRFPIDAPKDTWKSIPDIDDVTAQPPKSDELRRRSTRLYTGMRHGIVWNRDTRDGVVEVPLINFTARVVEQLVEDNGVEQRRAFVIEAIFRGRLGALPVPVGQFASLRWTLSSQGPEAVVSAGSTIHDHTRAASRQVLARFPAVGASLMMMLMSHQPSG